MPLPTRLAARLLPLAAAILPLLAAAAESGRGREPRRAARAVVETVNAVVASDINIAAAAAATCRLERLPGSVRELLPHLPQPHRLIIEECAGDRMRTRRGLENFGLDRLLDEGTVDSAGRDAIADAFAGRVVDVAVGTGLSAGPYPLSFDWAVVLDPDSDTLFSFVLNCRD
jgi:hypothetical protein